ncbi:hypothetical protein I3843_14G011600 [Carya illinoinensis]|nr:hypothetical protein I3843_14G011600 [Carya illinoinensis]
MEGQERIISVAITFMALTFLFLNHTCMFYEAIKVYKLKMVLCFLLWLGTETNNTQRLLHFSFLSFHTIIFFPLPFPLRLPNTVFCGGGLGCGAFFQQRGQYPMILLKASLMAEEFCGFKFKYLGGYI